MAYCDPSDVAARLGNDNLDVGVAIAAIDAATAVIDRWCGRTFTNTSTVSARRFYVDHPGFVVVDDIATTAGLIVATDEDGDGVYETTLTAAQYQLEPLGGVVDGVGGWPYTRLEALDRWLPLWRSIVGARRPLLQVTAVWGWAAVPAAVKTATVEVAVRQLSIPAGVKLERIGGYEAQYADEAVALELTKSDRNLLGSYRKSWGIA